MSSIRKEREDGPNSELTLAELLSPQLLRPAHRTLRGIGVGGSGGLPSEEFEKVAGDYLAKLVTEPGCGCIERAMRARGFTGLVDLIHKHRGSSHLYFVSSLGAVLRSISELAENPLTGAVVGILHRRSSSVFIDREYASTLSSERKYDLIDDFAAHSSGRLPLISTGREVAELWQKFRNRRALMYLPLASAGDIFPRGGATLQPAKALRSREILTSVNSPSSAGDLKIIEDHQRLLSFLAGGKSEGSIKKVKLVYDDASQSLIYANPTQRSFHVSPLLLELGEDLRHVLSFVNRYQLFAGDCCAVPGPDLDRSYAIHFAHKCLTAVGVSTTIRSLEKLQEIFSRIYSDPEEGFAYRLVKDVGSLMLNVELLDLVRKFHKDPKAISELIEMTGNALAKQSPKFWECYGLTTHFDFGDVAPTISELVVSQIGDDQSNLVFGYRFAIQSPASMHVSKAMTGALTGSLDSSFSKIGMTGAEIELKRLGLTRHRTSLPEHQRVLAPAFLQVLKSQSFTVHSIHGSLLFYETIVDSADHKLRGAGIRNGNLNGNTGTPVSLYAAQLFSKREEVSEEMTYVGSFTAIEDILARTAFLNTVCSDVFTKPPYTEVFSPAATAAVNIAMKHQAEFRSRALASSLLPIGLLLGRGKLGEEIGSICLNLQPVRTAIGGDVDELLEHYHHSPQSFWQKHSREVYGYLALIDKRYLRALPDTIRIATELLAREGERIVELGLYHQDSRILLAAFRLVASTIHAEELEETIKQHSEKTIRGLLRIFLRCRKEKQFEMATTFWAYQSNLRKSPDFHPQLIPNWINLLTLESHTTRHDVNAVDQVTPIVKILQSADREYRNTIAQSFASDTRSFTAFLQSKFSRELKAFVMENLPVDLIQSALQGRDTDDIRRLLSGFSLPQALDLTSGALSAHERRIVRGREVYERLCGQFPEALEHVIFDKEVPNYFAVLGVPRNSDVATIKKSYRLLADMYHNDKFMRESEESRELAKERLKLIVEAYKILTNEELRKEYFQAIPNRSHLYPTGPWFRDLPALTG